MTATGAAALLGVVLFTVGPMTARPASAAAGEPVRAGGRAVDASEPQRRTSSALSRGLTEGLSRVNNALREVLFFSITGDAVNVGEVDRQGRPVLDEETGEQRRRIIRVPLVVVVLALGSIFFTFWYRWVNLRGFKHGLDVIRGRYGGDRGEGEISHVQALTAALSGTVGLGNIAGVAIAIQMGGPGAVFWMLVAAVFGMSAKFSSCVLAQLYRRGNADGSISGGPMYYLDLGLGAKGGWWAPTGKCLGLVYAVMIVAGAFGGASMFQANQAFEAFSGGFSVSPTYNWIFGLGLGVLVGLVIIGGIKRIGVVTAKVVPAMGLLYVLASLLIIGKNMARVPDALSLILRSAFEGNAYYGGMAGTLVWGVRRAAFSNEAGGGSAAIVHAAARTDEPVRQGLVAMMGPFVDTIIICSMTALVVIVTGAWQDPTIPREAGVLLAAEAFRTVADWFPYVLTICILLFAYSTMISWCYYGEQGWGYLLDHLGRRSPRAVTVFRLLFLGSVFLGAVARLQEVLDFTDMIGLSRSLPNIVGSLILAPVVLNHLRGYWRRYTSGQMPASDELGNWGEAE